MKQMKYYRYPHPNNVGDTLTPAILEHFFSGDTALDQIRFKQVQGDYRGKLLMVGSIMRLIREGDIILGSGVMRSTDRFEHAKDCIFLAVRGKLSRAKLIRSGGDVPEVYGDPAVLLPLMYKPEIEVTHKVGIIPHFVDTRLVNERKAQKLARGADYKMIDVFLPWQEFVNEVLSCEHIVSSSLHGLIIAEAYGKSVEWVELSNKVIGKGFKFNDYLTGTERAEQKPGKFPALDPNVLKKQQDDLLAAVEKLEDYAQA